MTAIKFKNLFLLMCVTLLTTVSGYGQVTIVNYDFNSGSSYGTLSAVTASNISCAVTSTEAWQVYGGTASGANAFTANATAGNAMAMANSSGTNTRYFQFQLGGSELASYQTYKVYMQGQRSATGATVLTLAYSTNGTTFTNFATTQAPGNGSFTECPFDLTAISALNSQSAVYFRILASGASSTGTLRIDNFQIRATKLCTTPKNVSAGVTKIINCNNPIAVLTGSSTTSGVTYSWSPGGATTSTMSAAVAGTYTVKVTDPVNGCFVTSTVAVFGNTIAPVITISNPSPTLCIGNTTTLTASGAVSYTWVPSGTTNSIVVSPSVATTYSVTGTGANFCMSTKTISVNVSSIVVNAGANEFVSPGSVVSLGGSPTVSGGSGSYSYSWLPAVAYSPSSTHSNPSITVTGSGNYIVTVHDLLTGCINTASKIVSVDAPYYLHLKKILDAGYYTSHNNKIYFQFEEEYLDPTQVLNYSIVDDKNNTIGGIPAQIEVIGDNRYSLDLAGMGLSAGFYRIAVTNKKKEVFYARFKY